MIKNAKLRQKLFSDVKTSTNGVSGACCHTNHGIYQASFTKTYPSTVTKVKEQSGCKTVYLNEMIQAFRLLPITAKPIPGDSS